jgi:hypothetical protein
MPTGGESRSRRLRDRASATSSSCLPTGGHDVAAPMRFHGSGPRDHYGRGPSGKRTGHGQKPRSEARRLRCPTVIPSVDLAALMTGCLVPPVEGEAHGIARRLRPAHVFGVAWGPPFVIL